MMQLETRVYQALLRLYPRDFREKYSAEMTHVFQESHSREGSSFRFWARVVWDVISSAALQHGGNMPTKLAAFASLILVGLSATQLLQGLHSTEALHLTPIRMISQGVLVLTVCSAFLLRPKALHTPLWKAVLGSIVVGILMQIMRANTAIQMNWVSTLVNSSGIIILALITLDFVQQHPDQFRSTPTFWGLVVMTTCSLVTQFVMPPLQVNPQTRQFTTEAAQWFTVNGITVTLGWGLLAAGLWIQKTPSPPQTRASA